MSCTHYWDLPINSHFPRQDLTGILWNCPPGIDQRHFPAASSWASKPYQACKETFQRGLNSRQHHRYLSLREDIVKISSTVVLLTPSLPVPALVPHQLNFQRFCDFIPVCSERTRTQSTVLQMSKPSKKELYFPFLL